LIPRAIARNSELRALIDALQSSSYRRDLAALGPYDTSNTGEVLA